MTTHLHDAETFWTVLALAAGIWLCRFLPFLLFAGWRELPPTVEYLGRVLPHAAMAMLLVYCLKGTSIFEGTHGVPEALGVLATAGLHWRFGNVLLSIGGGTVLYMILVQRVFG